MVAMSMPRVVMKSAVHLCRSLARTGGRAERAVAVSTTSVTGPLRTVGLRHYVSVGTSLPPRPTRGMDRSALLA